MPIQDMMKGLATSVAGANIELTPAQRAKKLLQGGRYVDLPGGGQRFIHKTSEGWTPPTDPIETKKTYVPGVAGGPPPGGGAIKKAAEALGGGAGGKAGGLAGAAIGQAAIPIPGVGAAIGKVVGSALGKKVGQAGAKAATGGTQGKQDGGKKGGGLLQGASNLITSIGRSPETAKKEIGKGLRTAALVKDFGPRQRFRPEDDKQVAFLKEQMGPRDVSLSEGEKEVIRGGVGAQLGGGDYADPSRVGNQGAAQRAKLADREAQYKAATTGAGREIADENRIRFGTEQARQAGVLGALKDRTQTLEERDYESKQTTDFDRRRAAKAEADRLQERSAGLEKTLREEQAARDTYRRERDSEEGTPRWQQKKTGGMTRQEIIGSLGLGEDVPQYVLDMSQEGLYRLARDKGLI